MCVFVGVCVCVHSLTQLVAGQIVFAVVQQSFVFRERIC